MSRADGGWRIIATSPREEAFAASDERFADGRAELDPADPSVPNGLPPPSRNVLYTRLTVLLVFILIPLFLFELLR